ncbi:DUF4174 domain-containing protein [Lutimonas sp.]|uniref:DUF4174 domain-containing protein n=1 Tax=Lutimonas sp. TaxID=1872403 RepID=UPI003D9BE4AE
MKLFISFLPLSAILLWGSLSAQGIDDYRWKNRLVILASDSVDNETYKNQISELQADPEGLEIRKIKVISLTQGMQKTGMTESTFKEIHPGYKSFLSDTDSFIFYLIGLDGGVKYRSNTEVKNKTLFGLIDVMPMRRQEIEKN